MKLKDIGFFSRVNYSFRSIFTPFSWRNLAYINTSPQGRPGDKQAVVTQNLYKFDTPKCLFDWVALNDSVIAGDSKAEVVFNERDRCLRLQGRLVTRDRDKLEELPYIGMKLDTWKSYQMKLQNFNLLRLRVRTDGGPVRIICDFLTPIVGKRKASGIILDKSKEWQWLDLPFTVFQRPKDDIVDEQMKTIGMESIITDVAFKISSKVDRQARFQISDIAACWIPGVLKFARLYRKPVFYKSLQKYDKTVIVDNGIESIPMKL